MHLRTGQVVGERYEILEILGKGGMAIVYKARDSKLDRIVTLKVLREEYNRDDEFIKRFSVEAKAAAKLNHANIVSVYDVGIADNINYIVMEYIDGANLKEVIRARGIFSNEEVLGVAIQISEALEEAHKNGIIHRDIKPQNILVTIKGEIKVTDFGIARATNANTITTNSNSTMGSVHYFSPEQARGGFIDYKSDIYSLGISMFEMLTGKLPYDDDTVVAIALKHINEDLPDIKDFNSEAKDSVIKIIKRATEKVSSNRYENIRMMTLELKRALAKINNPNNLTDEEIKDIQEETKTIVIDESDLENIRNKAMTAFYNDEDFEELSHYLDEDRNKDNADKKAINTKLIVFAGALLALLITIISFFAIIRSVTGDRPVEVDVPSLVGMTLGDARTVASQIGVTVEEINQRFDDEVEAGVILEQDYLQGDVLYEGNTIKVITSLGSDKIEIPNLVGKTINEAYDELYELPFGTEEIFEYNDDIEVNYIIKQEPLAGTTGEQGDKLILYISRGKEVERVIVPNLVGLSEESAKARLESSGFLYGGSTYTFSSSVAKGNVINQTVTAGSQALEGATVAIIVSSGEKPVESSAPTEEPADDVEKPNATDSGNNTSTPSPVETTRILTLNPVFGEGVESADVKIIAETSANSGEVIYNKRVLKSDLPLELPVSGSGVIRYTLYADGSLVGEQSIDFGEGVN